MAGHSKWANIKHRKGKQDAAKGKIFTKLIREITVAAQKGADINANSTLRLAVDKALGQNMTRDTINRAIKRGTDSDDGTKMEAMTYEGYAVGGVAVLVDCLTDNRNRTAGEVRHAFTKHGGNLGASGSVAYLFKQRGLICCPAGSDENRIMDLVLDLAEDITTNDDGSVDVFTAVENFTQAKDLLLQAGIKPDVAEISMIATTQVAVDKDTGESVMKLIDALEDLDDVQEVHFNADFV